MLGFQFIDARAHRGDHAAVAITSDGETLNPRCRLDPAPDPDQESRLVVDV